MVDWLWQQVSTDGVFSIQAVFKTVLAVCGLGAVVVKAIQWLKGRKAAQRAQLALFRRRTKDYEQLAVRNVGSTSTATNVMLFFDGKPYLENKGLFGAPEAFPDLPPGHTEIISFVQTFDSYVDRAHVTWQDKAGKHETLPVQIEALHWID